MDLLIIISLLVAGLLLFIVEVFLIPGTTLAAIASALCLLAGIGHAFYHLGMTAGFATTGAAGIGCFLITLWFMRSKTIDRLSLKKSIDYRPNPLKGFHLEEGDEGVAVTRLALVGNAEFKGHVFEVRSSDGLIDEQTPICVDRIVDGMVLVKKLK